MKKIRIMTALIGLIVSAFLLPQKVFAVEIEYYELYLGSTQVNSGNKHNILNQTDPDTGKPTASFDPDTRVLELHSPGISGSHNDSLIYSERPLKVKGKLEGTYTCKNGFRMANVPLEFFEDEDTKTDISITIDQGLGGVVAGDTDQSVRSNVTVSGGKLYFEHSNGAAVACRDLTVNGGRLYMKHSLGYNAAICKQLVLGTGCRMKIPEGGSVTGGAIVWPGNLPAPEVLIELEKYDLFVGGVQLDARNASDVLDDGKVSFTPAEGGGPAVLTLDNAVIKVADIDNGYNNSAGIYVGDGRNGTAVNDLCIKLIGENTITLPSYTPQDGKISGILAYGNVEDTVRMTIDGSGGDGNGTLDIDLAWTGDTSRAVYGFYSSHSRSLDVRDAVLNMSLHSEWGTVGIMHLGDLRIGAEDADPEATQLNIDLETVNGTGSATGVNFRGNMIVNGLVNISVNQTDSSYVADSSFGIFANGRSSGLSVMGGRVDIATGSAMDASVGIAETALHLGGGQVSVRAGKALESRALIWDGVYSYVDVADVSFFDNGGKLELSGYSSACTDFSLSDSAVAKGVLVNGEMKPSGAAVWDGQTGLSTYKYLCLPAKLATLTIHWSSVEGEDIEGQPPIVYGGIAPGTTLEEALVQEGKQIHDQFFKKEGYDEESKGLKPFLDYADWEEVRNDDVLFTEDVVIEGDLDVYCLMARLIDKAAAKVAPPVCGVMTETDEIPGWYGWDLSSQSNKPVVTLPDGAPYCEAPPDESGYRPLAWWMEADFSGPPYIGEFEGGQDYLLGLAFMPEIGYRFFDKTQVELEGAELLNAFAELMFCMQASITAVHDWGDAVYKWTQNGEDWACTATRVCKSDTCGHPDEQQATVTSEVTQKPTHETPGIRTFTATFTDSGLETQTKTVEIPPTPVVTYLVTVTDGKADPQEAGAGAVVTVTANNNGREFERWIVTPGTVSLGDATARTTTFTMPAEDVSLKATYRDPRLTGITLDSKNAKKEYEEGDALDLSGLKLTASYSDGSTKKVNVTKGMVSGFDGTKPGKQKLTVTYGGHTAEYEVEVRAKPAPGPTPVTVTGIKLGSDNAKKEYTEGDALDVSGLKLTVSKSDGSTETVPVTNAMVSGFDGTKPGKQTLTVTYEGFTAEYEVEVRAKPAPGPTPVTVTGIKLGSDSAKKEYTEGDPLDVSGLNLTVSKSDGSTETVPVTKEMVSGFDGAKPGRQTLTVTYEGCTVTFEVEVKAKPAPKPTPGPESGSDDEPEPESSRAVFYSIKDGAGNGASSVTWHKGSVQPLTVIVNRSENDSLTYEQFNCLMVDGQTVDETQYVASAGSLKLSIRPEFLETLRTGDHYAWIGFNDGSAALNIEIAAAGTQTGAAGTNSAAQAPGANPTQTNAAQASALNANTPNAKPLADTPQARTGDSSHPALYGSLMLAALAMLAAVHCGRKRRAN